MSKAIIKAHWECWDRCNLHCRFCYRMKEAPLETTQALRMISMLAQAGMRQLVFAGGDPSLRADIAELTAHARASGLQVEVQTNAHLFTRVFVPILDQVDLFGFSLDSGHAAEHDTLRGGAGNHDRVLRAIAVCEAAGRPYVVRTMCSALNADGALAVGGLLEGKQWLRRWSVVEFSPVGEGFANRSAFEMHSDAFRVVSESARARFPALTIDSYPNTSKGGVYFLLKPNGDAYTTVRDFAGPEYVAAGNLHSDGVEACLSRLEINTSAHLSRYGSLFGSVDV